MAQGSLLPGKGSMEVRLNNYEPHLLCVGAARTGETILQKWSTGYGIKA